MKLASFATQEAVTRKKWPARIGAHSAMQIGMLFIKFPLLPANGQERDTGSAHCVALITRGRVLNAMKRYTWLKTYISFQTCQEKGWMTISQVRKYLHVFTWETLEHVCYHIATSCAYITYV